jgi:hypothetical protein
MTNLSLNRMVKDAGKVRKVLDIVSPIPKFFEKQALAKSYLAALAYTDLRFRHSAGAKPVQRRNAR